MQIHSGLLNAQIELDAYTNNEKNIIVTHKALVAYVSQMRDIFVEYEVIKAEREHAVVICSLFSKQFDKKQIEFGETTKETLGKSFSNYPVITAQEMAFDRAAIKLLQLPNNCYSVLEFLKNAEKPAQEKPNSQKQNQKKADVKDFIVEIGIFAGTGATVQQIFEQAQKDKKIQATLDLYLSKDASSISAKQERFSIFALQKYAKQVNYTPVTT